MACRRSAGGLGTVTSKLKEGDNVRPVLPVCRAVGMGQMDHTLVGATHNVATTNSLLDQRRQRTMRVNRVPAKQRGEMQSDPLRS